MSAIEKRSLKERIFKINRKLAKVVEQTKLCDDNTEPSYCIFILLSLKICEKVSSMLEVEKEIRETFEATVSNSLRMFEKLWRKHGVSGSTINLLTILLYLEEKDFKIKSSIMNEILAQFEIKPTNLQSLIHNLEIKLKEFSKLENSTSLKVTAKQLDYYSVRIIDFLWRQPEDLLWKSLNNGRILVEDLAFECFPIINRNEIPFDLLFKGVLGNSWKLDQLKARYNTISPVITEGYPTFKISPQEKLKILRITCQKLTENIFPTSNKVENGQFGGLYLSRKLDETIGKCVMDALFESSPKNEIFVNFGKLFTKIEPTLLKEKI